MPNVNPKNTTQAPEAYCAECMKRVSSADAYDPEGLDHEISFCGLECYEAWSRKAERDKASARDVKARPSGEKP